MQIKIHKRALTVEEDEMIMTAADENLGLIASDGAMNVEGEAVGYR